MLTTLSTCIYWLAKDNFTEEFILVNVSLAKLKKLKISESPTDCELHSVICLLNFKIANKLKKPNVTESFLIQSTLRQLYLKK